MDPDNKEAILGVQQVEGILQDGFSAMEAEEDDEGGGGGGGENSRRSRREGNEEEENKMEESEEVLILGSRESLDGVREVRKVYILSSFFYFA